MRGVALARVVRFGLLNYWRGGALSFSATVIVGITLFIISAFALHSYSVRETTAAIQDKLDMAVYLSDSPSEEDVLEFIEQIRRWGGVEEVVYLNKDAVLEEWRGLTLDERIKNQVSSENNPLPRTIKIKTEDPAQLESVAGQIAASTFADSVRNVSYRNNRPVIEALNNRAKLSLRNGLIVSAIFSVIAILFLFHAIRVTIKFRSDEISVMKLVGATNSFVLGPFLIEGVLHGLIGSLVAFGGLWAYVKSGLTSTGTVVADTNTLVAQAIYDYFRLHAVGILLAIVGIGIVVSLASVWLSLRKYIKGEEG